MTHQQITDHLTKANLEPVLAFMVNNAPNKKAFDLLHKMSKENDYWNNFSNELKRTGKKYTTEQYQRKIDFFTSSVKKIMALSGKCVAKFNNV